jgi:hypothetical protein
MHGCCNLTLAFFAAVQCGWTHGGAVAELEVKRKEAAAAFYQEKKKQLAARAKAVAKVAA